MADQTNHDESSLKEEAAESEKLSHKLDSSGEEDAFRKRQRQSSPSPSSTLSYSPSASPHKHATFKDLLATTGLIQNLSLVHELVMNDKFKLSPPELPKNSMQKQIHDVMHKAFWEILSEQLEADPPKYDDAILLLGEIREGLVSLLLPRHDKLRSQIMDVIDLDLIRQQADHNALDVTRYSDFIVSTMAKLCAPVRDDDIKKLRETEGVVPLYRNIFHLLDLMKMDMANFSLESLKPVLQQHSVEYERDKFQQFLKTQQDGLQHTRRWLMETKKNLSPISSSTSDAIANLSAGRVATVVSTIANSPSTAVCDSEKLKAGSSTASDFVDSDTSPIFILNQAYVGLLHWDVQQIHMFPETVLMDHGRFMDLGQQFDKACLIASVLLVTYTNVGPAISGIQGLPTKLKYAMSVLLVETNSFKMIIPNVAEQVCSEVSTCLKEHGFPAMGPSQLDALKNQILALSDENHPVRILIDSRAKDFLVTSISSPPGEDLASKIPSGLRTLQRQMLEMASLFSRLVVHNRSVYGPFYSEIIAKLLNVPR